MSSADDSGAAADRGGPVSEVEYAEQMQWRQLGLLMDLNEAFPLPDGMYFDLDGEFEWK